MKKVLLSLMAAGLLLASLALPAVAAPGGVTNPATLNELAQARRATQQYQNDELPTANGWAGPVGTGYIQVSPNIPGMGYHYLNESLIGPFFNPETPGILLYADAGNGRRLVGVEYLVLDVLPPDPGFSDGLPDNEPEGFAGDEDEWEFHQAECHYTDGSEEYCASPGDADIGKTLAIWHPDLWTLHVWLWQGNPAGIFTPFNPNI